MIPPGDSDGDLKLNNEYDIVVLSTEQVAHVEATSERL